MRVPVIYVTRADSKHLMLPAVWLFKGIDRKGLEFRGSICENLRSEGTFWFYVLCICWHCTFWRIDTGSQRSAWSSLVVTQPSAGHHNCVCGVWICVCVLQCQLFDIAALLVTRLLDAEITSQSKVVHQCHTDRVKFNVPLHLQTKFTTVSITVFTYYSCDAIYLQRKDGSLSQAIYLRGSGVEPRTVVERDVKNVSRIV